MSQNRRRNETDATFSQSSRRLLSKVDRILSVPTKAVSLVGAFWILAIMILVNLDVFGRYLASRPIDGVPEIVSLSIVGIVFLQLGNSLREGRFIRSDVFLNAVEKKHSRTATALNVIYGFIGALIFAILVYYIYPKLMTAYDRGTYVGSFGRFTMPIWPILTTILLGSVLVTVQYLLRAVLDILDLLHRPISPEQS